MGNETDNPKQVMSLELEESDPTTASAAGRVPRVSFDAASTAGNPARIDDPAILPGARSAPTVSHNNNEDLDEERLRRRCSQVPSMALEAAGHIPSHQG